MSQKPKSIEEYFKINTLYEVTIYGLSFLQEILPYGSRILQFE